MPIPPNQAKAVFDQAVELTDPVARAACIDRECAGNPALRERVEELLRAHAEAGSFLAHPPAAAAGGPMTTDQPTPDPAGTVLAGRYKLLEEIGEGGMGAVWMAQQTEPVKRLVAVKLIKPGMDSRQVVARFGAERQALALMDHPNIAKVHDAGATDGGRPYFVMELVRGVPITKYCDDHHLTPRQRLELFLPVCQAVQHAHQKGIIHRDIKPSNVLVALYDGRPVPKVIDFGVAKAAGQPLTEKTLVTGFGAIVGTLEYMSPEQAEVNQLDIDTRSDIYSLGVLLYELLTGSPPFSRKELEKVGLLEMLRVIREREPSKPSTKLSSSDALPTLSANRGTEPTKLTKLVRGELDWIVMKALEKDRNRRYETANGFAMDVQRYLADEAVQACPPSVGYRLRKFVRRNRGPVLAAALLVLSLVAGIVGTTWGLVRATRAAEAERLAKRDTEEQKENAVRSAAEARAKEAEANAVVKFFEDTILAAGRPKGELGGLGHDVSLRDAVRASLPSLGTSFRDQPLVEARLRMALEITFRSLGDAVQAAEQGEQATALCIRHLGPDHHDTLRCMNNLAYCYTDLNRHAEAVKLHERALAAWRRVRPPDHQDTLRGMISLANSYAAANRPAEALQLREDTLAAQKRVLPPDHPDTLTTMNNLANSYAVLDRPADALKLREETLAARRRVLPPDHPDTLMSMNNLANSYADLNRHAEALKLREETLAARRRVLPPDHPDTLKSMNNLAYSYTDLDRFAEAVKLHEEIVAARRRVLPPDHPDTLMSMFNLASGYAVLKRHTESVLLHEETLAARRRVLSSDHPDTLTSMNNLACGYSALNRRAEAVKLHEETLAARRRVLPPDHPDTLQSMYNLTLCYTVLNRSADALKLIDELLAKADQPGAEPSWFPSAIMLRLQCYQKLADAAGCRATADLLEKRNPTDAAHRYDTACARAVTAAVQAKAPGADAARLAGGDADKAMTWLTKAVAAGWTDVAHMKKDSDLTYLRDRADFKKLVTDLEARKK
jgi:eukaryotic-like serine/threonine-protein kinase